MKIATWNVCLGLTSKKDEIERMLINEDIDICLIQEAEIPMDFPINDITIRGYSIEVETNKYKLRTCTYIKNGISYKRRKDLEGSNNHIVIIDIFADKTYRIVNLYRVFNTFGPMSPFDKFKNQLTCISGSNCRNLIVAGDFNLNEEKRYSNDYQCWKYFEELNNTFDPMALIQLVDFPTWQRCINGQFKSSTIDHVYCNDSTLISNLHSVSPFIGDHLIITFCINEKLKLTEPSWRRNWKNYNTEALNDKLAQETWTFEADSLQDYWNILEVKLINIVDELIPFEQATNNFHLSEAGTSFINNKLNKRKRLLKKFNSNKTVALKIKIKTLDKAIRGYFSNKKKKRVRSKIMPNNNKSLWDAVKIAKNLNTQNLPDKLSLNDRWVNNDQLPDAFANYFKSKVDDIVNESIISNTVYNGRIKITATSSNFMSIENVKDCIMSLKTKNTEGFDRIPQRVLKDGCNHLLIPLTTLMNKIYNEKEIPDQWRISKIVPVHKKGECSKIENYRPISNLCSSSKVFEKLIMKRIESIQTAENVDLTGNAQHGFKKSRSTATAGLTLQAILSRALDRNEYAMMSSLDLSAAFDVVNVKLLIKRLKIVGLPSDLVDLIQSWLSQRMYSVNINGKYSMYYNLESGTIQGSILGPFLYAIYVSPLSDIVKITSFADDNYIIHWNKSLITLNEEMSSTLNLTIKWLNNSGLKVNPSKTELCIFHKNSEIKTLVNVNGVMVESGNSINVLGVEFDSKLQWCRHVSNTIKKSYKSLHAIRIIRKFFTKRELNMLITSNFFSILYYNSEIWHLPTLNVNLKRNIRTASANAMKLCTPNYHYSMSYDFIHQINNRAQPYQILKYKLALLLFKIYRDKIPTHEWLALNDEQTFTSRQTKCIINSTSRYKVGYNTPTRRLTFINNTIELSWLNLSFDCFKVKCKNLFLSNNIIQ